jgi:putative component of membrane protein insertase Oxa1/YidC/SpoIIIJ protein YidD
MCFDVWNLPDLPGQKLWVFGYFNNFLVTFYKCSISAATNLECHFYIEYANKALPTYLMLIKNGGKLVF